VGRNDDRLHPINACSSLRSKAWHLKVANCVRTPPYRSSEAVLPAGLRPEGLISRVSATKSKVQVPSRAFPNGGGTRLRDPCPGVSA